MVNWSVIIVIQLKRGHLCQQKCASDIHGKPVCSICLGLLTVLVLYEWELIF